MERSEIELHLHKMVKEKVKEMPGSQAFAEAEIGVRGQGRGDMWSRQSVPGNSA